LIVDIKIKPEKTHANHRQERQDPEPAHFKTIEQTIPARVSARGNTTQYTSNCRATPTSRLTRLHARCGYRHNNLPWACTTFQPGQKASTYRILDACFGTRPSLPYLRYTCTLDPDPHWRSIPTVDAVLFLPGLSCCCSTTKEKKKRGRGSMMCDYTQVEYACGHLRFTVRAWCKWSGITDALLKLDADRSSLQASSIRNRTSDVLRTSSQSSTG
jgi:hypothetical protein